jgi:hypothetical protein
VEKHIPFFLEWLMLLPGKKLTQFVHLWKDSKASPEVTGILKFGHKIVLKDWPKLILPPTVNKIVFRSNENY